MGELVAALKALVLACSHHVNCPSLPHCTCGQAEALRLAHGEACGLLRRLGALDGHQLG